MTVSSSIADTRYAGDGSTTLFATGFKFYANAALRVSTIVDATGVETVKALTTDYTIIGGAGATGSVVMNVAPASGTTLVIKRVEPYTQETDLGTNDPLPAEVLELTFDKLAMQIQQVDYLVRRAVIAEPSFDPNTDDAYTVPAPVSGKILSGKADGTGWENIDPVAGPTGPQGPAGPAGAGSGDALVANPLSQFAATTSAQLRSVLSDETGTGAAVFATAPTLVNPVVGTQLSGDNSTKAASTAFVQAALTTGGAWTTGDVKVTLKAAADSGWVLLNDGSIGNGASAATTRANADTEALFTLLWTNCADAECPVSGGRGANAAADFAANKRLTLPLSMGRALGISGAGAGLTSRALGKTTGAETHALVTGELASHTHAAGTLVAPVPTPTGAVSVDFTLEATNQDAAGPENVAITGSTAAAGSGTAHNNMQPTTFLNAMIKL